MAREQVQTQAQTQLRVLLLECDKDVRETVRDILAEALGRASVFDMATPAQALGFLAHMPEGVVVVVGNCHADHHQEATFFAQVVADPQLAVRHQYLLLTTEPPLIPTALYLQLRQLHAPIVRKPFTVEELLTRVRTAAAYLTSLTHWPSGGAGSTGSTAASPDRESSGGASGA